MELIREERMRGVESLLMRAIADGRAAGLSDGELKEMFNLLMESDD